MTMLEAFHEYLVRRNTSRPTALASLVAGMSPREGDDLLQLASGYELLFSSMSLSSPELRARVSRQLTLPWQGVERRFIDARAEPMIDPPILSVPHRQGKVRALYDFGAEYLVVTTDRISALDRVLVTPVAWKGISLNTLSRFWFNFTKDVFPNHYLGQPSAFMSALGLNDKVLARINDRSMVVRKAVPLPAELIVRGYLAGSVLDEYRRLGTVNGLPPKKAMQPYERFPEPLFTPTTKAPLGQHDVALTWTDFVMLLGDPSIANTVMEAALSLYRTAFDYALTRGVIIADTKFEMGWITRPDGTSYLAVIDELFTPDSSRFWPVDQYGPPSAPPSMDKQPVRDWLAQQAFPQGAEVVLPLAVAQATSDRYVSICERLTGINIREAASLTSPVTP